MISYFKNKLNPSGYQGKNSHAQQHFEGWYFKIVDKHERHIFAIIPGIYRSRNASDSYTFIQIFDGHRNETYFHTFPIHDFHTEPYQFNIQIGKNQFSANELVIDIQTTSFNMKGQLTFNSLTPWPGSLVSPGIMGWYTWVPFMECYHGIVSLDHHIQGILDLNGQKLDFTNGKGYIEKDWGQSFPDAWVWCQSNHFNSSHTCVTGSIAIIPWIRRPFLGYIFGLWHDQRLYRFTTYTGAQLEHFEITDSCVEWVLYQKNYRLEINGRRTDGGFLHAPTINGMTHRISESLQSSLEVRLSCLKGSTWTPLFHNVGRHAGFEVAGNIDRLVTMYQQKKSKI
ncbi:hypothetical protein JW960_21490 [candidate division KSB1 bacterium]|nr:hypothetical protein [candidate division KSB1 bacterium]